MAWDNRGHWDGDTLVIDTTNIVSGDSVSTDPAPDAPQGRSRARQCERAGWSVSEGNRTSDPDWFAINRLSRDV